jgi:hypothetical protein
MRLIYVLTLLYLTNFNYSTVIDRQVAVAVGFDNANGVIKAYTIAGGTPQTKYYDNVITYTMKYFLDGTNDDLTYSDHDCSASRSSIFTSITSFYYSFARSEVSGSTYTTSRCVDSDLVGGVPNNALFMKSYPVLFKTKPVDYAYLAFNLSISCTSLGGSPPLITFKAKFFCSDEEAKAEYDSIVAAIGANGLVAYINMNGDCFSQSDTNTYSGVNGSSGALNTASTVCQLLKGHTTALCA